MKTVKWVLLGLLFSAAAGANHYGVRLSELAQSSVPQPQVIAQADTQAALLSQLQQQSETMEINQLLAEQPTAAGGEQKLRQKRVVDRCYHSVQAVACSTKVVYQLIE
ncbi:hypothetical protein [Ferrimonas kyonanensis]|uniref:hypothetical protein n=1 Tax=Ferrimonas kyonanensis TaxID=364763 RepID=UPI00040E10EE|nr:hypothetical protein [Ferrimonas kyonanensis]